MLESTKNILLFEAKAFAARVLPVECRDAGFHFTDGALGAVISGRDGCAGGSVPPYAVICLKMGEMLPAQRWPKVSGGYFGASANDIGDRIAQCFVP